MVFNRGHTSYESQVVSTVHFFYLWPEQFVHNYSGENMKYDPMMDDSSDDGLPDLEELPALDKASNADFEVSLYSKCI